MSPDQISALRKELKCTRKELADVLGVSARLVLDWEHDQKFPTKQHVRRMAQLLEQGPGAVPRKRRGGGATPPQEPLQVLADPELWSIVRKLLTHTELRQQVAALAADFTDPADA